VWATIKGEATPRVLELLMTQARTRNSTLWTEDPKQQIAYLAQKRWARLHAPDVLLGVYTTDELDHQEPREMGSVEVVSPWTPDQLAQAAEAASKGAKAYSSWWKTLDAETMKKLVTTTEHQSNKDTAQRADAARTVDATPPAPPKAEAPATGEIVTTVADVRKRLEDAKSEDSLYVAMDWSNALSEADQAAHLPELEALFNTRLAAIRGA
jgi:hypothetical protein